MMFHRTVTAIQASSNQQHPQTEAANVTEARSGNRFYITLCSDITRLYRDQGSFVGTIAELPSTDFE